MISLNMHRAESVELYQHHTGSTWLQLRCEDGDTVAIHFDESTRESWLKLLNLSYGETWNLKTGEIEKE